MEKLLCDAIVCIERKPDYSKQRFFFGEYDHLIRIDYLTSQTLRNLKENAEANTWFVNQIDYTRDKIGWEEKLPDVAKRMFLYNLNYQNAMDSGVTNGFGTVLVPIITDPNLALLYMKIAYEESIHAESYSHASVSVFGERATEYLDLVYSDPFIKQRLAKEVDAYSDVKHYILEAKTKYNTIMSLIELGKLDVEDKDVQNLLDTYDPRKLENDENKMRIIKLIIANLYLEGIKFPLSFYVTWNLNKQYNMPLQGIDTLLKEIAHDELNTHVPTGNFVLKVLREDESQGFSHLWKEGKVQELAIDMLKYIIEQEDLWIDFLCQEGEIPGFNREIGRHFIRYYADVRLKAIGVDPIYKEEESDIIKWFKSYSNINKQNVALQERDNASYKRVGLKNNVDTNQLLKQFESFYFGDE